MSRTSGRGLSQRGAALLLTLGGILAGGVSPSSAQVSPGAMSRAHASLEGVLKCFKCHGSGSETMDAKCLDCHREIAWLRERARGLHAKPDLGECASCHPDHGGEDLGLVRWEEGSAEKFDHTRAGWPLRGKHATTECRKCHEPSRQVSESARLSQRAQRTPGWIGLEPGCNACHERQDAHRGALGRECGTCHDSAGWKPAPSFDHARAAYPLQGEHLRVGCAKCHEAPHLDLAADAQGRRVPLYKPLSYQECSSCHRDPHDGRLGETCARCHSPEDFRRIAQGVFDHARTRFPLQGSHRTVACARCHDPKAAPGTRPAMGPCAACHQDPHAGQATLAGGRVDCAACHAVEGWKTPAFPIEKHAKSSFPLEGRHRQVACGSCHAKKAAGSRAPDLGRAGVIIRPAHARCADCHRDAHGGQLASRSDRGACESCHGVDGWKPSLFKVADHRALRLPLEGRHEKVPCSGCHGPQRPGLPPVGDVAEAGEARVSFKIKEIECGDCHLDPHGGRFASKGARGEALACGECHDAARFRPSKVGPDAHGRFAFRLEGAHRAVPCNICHKELDGPPAPSTLRLAAKGDRRIEFSQQRSLCADCHKDPHGGQFAARRGGGACSDCHGVDRFRPASRFDHGRDTSFRLEGGHARIGCARCHAPVREPAGSETVVYAKVPKRCDACHLPGPKRGVAGPADSPPRSTSPGSGTSRPRTGSSAPPQL